MRPAGKDRRSQRVLPKHHYRQVELRAYMPSCSETQEVGLAFNELNGSVTRLRLSAADAASLLYALAADHVATKCGCQSPMSSDSPSVDGSIEPTHSVCPPAKSSSACCGVLYPAPSESPACSMRHLCPGLLTMVNPPMREPWVKAMGVGGDAMDGDATTGGDHAAG